ncbi:MAG: TonB-dependent receptor plug domain-containing protein, partial [Flavobacteriales bacterium]
MKPISRENCTVPVEIYHSSYFSKNPTPNIFEALANVNGVRPQVNCNICNTGDIHINGLEGPYTMILIDGMPIVSALSTVYGLSGIPTSMIDRIEVVKGPASALYGSEAVGGLINVITKKVSEAPLLSLESTINSWGEWNNDVMFKVSPTKRLRVLSGINYFNYQQPRDDNDDGFTDVTLQDRWSIFQKWSLQRKSNKLLQWGARYVYEDRWGGELDWTPEFRGGDSIYGESIYTRRWEIIGNYELPFSKKILFSFSYNHHDQDSRYGTMSYIADQEVLFGQLTWDEQYKGHDLLTGIAYRFTRYDDNTPATEYVTDQRTINRESRIVLPGLFVQDEWTLNERNKMLLGYRIDKSNEHGWIHTPRIGYKWSRNMRSILRWNAGTGFRNVNVFAEDHAALTGARTVIIQEDLKPERSWNSNINWIQKFYGYRWRLTLDASVFYTHFTDRIFTDYESNVDQILYRNIAGYSYSRGGSLNLDLNLSAWSLNAGITAMDVGIQEGELTTRPL